jgi:hypothetical protein
LDHNLPHYRNFAFERDHHYHTTIHTAGLLLILVAAITVDRDLP